MNNVKIGQFIAKCRKEKKLTQKQLAEKLGISDRAVSKWERGLNMPDVSLFEQLCKELDISINELISGEKLNDDEYKTKAEENLIMLFSSKKKLLYLRIVAELLVLFGGAIMLVLPDILDMTLIQNITIRLIGLFIFGCGTTLGYYIQSIFYQKDQKKKS